MKLYSSFLIRCWLVHDSACDERSVIDVEHIQTGCHTRAASLAEAEEWMVEACRTMQPPRRAVRVDGRKRERQ
jgi:hypothetical protein